MEPKKQMEGPNFDEAIRQRQREMFLQKQKIEQMQKLEPNSVEVQFQYLVDQKRTWKSDNLSYDSHMHRSIHPSFKPEDVQNEQDFAENVLERNSLPSNKLGTISKEKIIEAVGNLIQITGVTETTASGVGNNTGVRLTSTISDNKDKNRIMFAIPEITAYQTSVTSGNIIPYGSDAINAGYKLHFAPDLRDNQISDEANAGMTWIFSIYNASGGSKDIIFRSRYRFIGRNTAS